MVFKRKQPVIKLCNSNVNKGLSLDGLFLADTYANSNVLSPFNRGSKTEKTNNSIKYGTN